MKFYLQLAGSISQIAGIRIGTEEMGTERSMH